MTGRVVKAVGGRFEVAENNSLHSREIKIYTCYGRGKIKLKTEIYIGDKVEFSVKDSGEEGIIERIIPRSNLLIRPTVANVDQIILVVSSLPAPDMILIDKMIIMAVSIGIDLALCVNKKDISSSEPLFSYFKNVYQKFIEKIIFTSSKTGEGLDDLKQIINNKISCVCGQSAVGKSSLINSITNAGLKTDGLTAKINRGKHTTRHAVLLSAEEGFLMDTPGFSLLNIDNIRAADLYKYYEDFMDLQCDCKYNTCMHINEPECAVKSALGHGIDKDRYQRYRHIYNELAEKNKYN